MAYIRLLLLCAVAVYAQDPFEIHVYEYEPLARGEFTYEAHLNYVLQGTKMFDGTVAPTNNQWHYTSEFTAGLTNEIRGAVVLLTARRPDQTWEYAGFRVLPHFYAPQAWHLPLNLGLVAEFSFPRTTYDENSAEVELRPIVEKHIGRLQLDGNPVFARALHGPGVKDGWRFEPAARVGWQVSRSFTPSLEYYSSWGPVTNILVPHDRLQQVFPGGDVRLGKHLTWSFGVGFGVTGGGSELILKSHFEYEFGKSKSQD
jgi:hypothetical protein